MSKTYTEKLKDPRWQKKRLEVFNRDNWTCQHCNDHTTELNAHHPYYTKGLEPWEYDTDFLITLCNPCHEMQHRRNDGLAHYSCKWPDAFDEMVWRFINNGHSIDPPPKPEPKPDPEPEKD